ncbi:hypothetical protein VIGAN_05248700 [Vigna angularis var. angularis]|uniref:Uncharacterized protein n=1 Tax=Vigna angularis var. angularis TaxID=157739 RepID=A0A0S3S7P9_PHAAN|nr:hypothetical protein VIGAN_05248700 [Vigna angularis var. angularis]
MDGSSHGWSSSPASSTIPATWLQSSRGSSYRKEKSYDVLHPADPAPSRSSKEGAVAATSRRPKPKIVPLSGKCVSCFPPLSGLFTPRWIHRDFLSAAQR